MIPATASTVIESTVTWMCRRIRRLGMAEDRGDDSRTRAKRRGMDEWGELTTDYADFSDVVWSGG